MRVLVCGDRHWTDRDFLFHELDLWHLAWKIDLVIEGCARGADSLAGNHPPEPPGPFADDPGFPGGWAWARGVPGEHHLADWARYHRAAGPIRNREMLTARPDVALAFHDDIEHSKGTADMVSAARKAGVPVHLFSHHGEETR